MANGFFVTEAGDVIDGKRQLTVLFVFDVDPIDIAATRIKPTPANVDGVFVLGEVAQLLLEIRKPGVIAALDAGEAVYQWVQLVVDDPIEPAVAVAQAQELWTQMYVNGQKLIYEQRFQYAGTWVDMTPGA
jgi:hypothetical protein